MWFNPLMIWILRSPLHVLLSRSFMLITLTGKKSGKTYTLPVNYLRNGDTLWVTSQRDRKWWRNLIGGAPVGVLLAGREISGRGEAIVEEKAVAESLQSYFRREPKYAGYYHEKLEPNREPVFEDGARAALERVMIRIGL